LPHLPVCVWRRVHRTLYRDLTLPQGATRLALMPPAMAGPISLYLSAVGRHRLLGAELQSRLKAFQVTLYARADRAGSEGISQSL